MAKISKVLAFFYLVVMISGRFQVRSAESTLEQQLIKDLLNGYNKDAHPTRNGTRYHSVTFGLEIVQLVNVDDKNQVITTNVWVRQRWVNELLTWNPNKYGGIKRIRVDANLVWIPDIVMYNSADSEFSGGLEKYKTRIIMEYNGTNKWYSPASFRSTCNIDITYFPLDVQDCSLKFGSWTFEVVDLDIMMENSPMYSSQYVKSAEWDLLNAYKQRNVQSYACCEHPFSDVTINFRIRRKPLFYMFNLITPCLLILGMVLLGFLLPPESGERIALSITVLLAMAVFLQLAAENLPRNSDSIPLLGIFYITVMSEVALSLIATCYVLNVHHRNAGTTVVHMPQWIKFYILKGLGRLLCVKPPAQLREYASAIRERSLESVVVDTDSGATQNNSENDNSAPNGEASLNGTNETLIKKSPPKLMARKTSLFEFKMGSRRQTSYPHINKGIMVLADNARHHRDVELNQQEWKHLAMVMDRLFFWLFVLMIIISTTIILKIVPQYQLRAHRDR